MKTVPRFHLPSRERVIPNRLMTGRGRTGEMLIVPVLDGTPQCDCGHTVQTAKHAVEECQRRAIQGGVKHLH